MMRLDRVVTLGLVDPVRRLFRTDTDSARAVLPVLMYHSISEDPELGWPAYFRVCTSPRRFGEQMTMLRQEGWQGVSLTEGLAGLQAAKATGSVADRRMIAITFDDGFRDFCTKAVPILQDHGFTATMYLPTGYIADERRSFNGRECMTWTEVRELAALGMEFGSHTVSHPRLAELGWPDIERELRSSKAALEEKVTRPVTSFSYPYNYPQTQAAFTGRLRSLLKEIGYESAVTTIVGRIQTTDDPLQLSRLPVNEADDASLLRAKLRGSYDWMRTAQSFRKRLGGWSRAKSRVAQPNSTLT